MHFYWSFLISIILFLLLNIWTALHVFSTSIIHWQVISNKQDLPITGSYERILFHFQLFYLNNYFKVLQSTSFDDLDIFYVGEDLLDQRNIEINTTTSSYFSCLKQVIQNCGYLRENEIITYLEHVDISILFEIQNWYTMESFTNKM